MLKPCAHCGADLDQDTATHPGAITDDDCLFSGKVIEPEDFDKWERRKADKSQPTVTFQEEAETVERVARAICATVADPDELILPETPRWVGYITEANAAIEAMNRKGAQMTERISPEMLEAATHVAAWSGDWIHSDSLPEIYEAMRALDPDCAGAEWEMERVLQEAAFIHGAQSCREMMARFVECESPAIANSIRLNWKPSWGEDPGPLPGSIPHNAFGETAETDALLVAIADTHPKDGDVKQAPLGLSRKD